MTEEHDFENTVVAILDRQPAVSDATDRLAEEGYEYEILVGQEGKDHLNPDSEDGLVGAVRSLIRKFGDQHRIVERLEETLDSGRSVISVEIEDEDPESAISILKSHGGSYIWRLGEWTFTPIED